VVATSEMPPDRTFYINKKRLSTFKDLKAQERVHQSNASFQNLIDIQGSETVQKQRAVPKT